MPAIKKTLTWKPERYPLVRGSIRGRMLAESYEGSHVFEARAVYESGLTLRDYEAQKDARAAIVV